MYNDFSVIRFGGSYCGRDNKGRGLVAFSHDRDGNEQARPYIPCGGYAAWKAIKDMGGFLNLRGMEFAPEPREINGRFAAVCN